MGRGKQNKGQRRRPRREFEPTEAKRPKSKAVADWLNERLQFTFDSFDYRMQWGSDKSQHSCVASACDKLRSFNKQKWSEVRTSGNSHPIAVDNLCKEAKDRLLVRQVEDIDEVWSVRINKKQRVWGIRRGAILDVLWWDPEHQVYPMDIKKNKGGASKSVCSIRK